jgi:DNA-binding response OmpR family regulator
MKILLVEDDPRLSRSLARLLEQDRHNVEVAHDGETGLDVALGENGIDVVILDIGLPDISGVEVARRIRRERKELAILMLTARDTVNDRVTGLDAGADDYVVKPFSGPEVIARIRAVLRRTGAAADGDRPTRVEGLELDLASRRVTLEGEEIELSRKEFDLLAALMERAGRVVRRETLMEEVWDENWFGSTRTLDTHIGWLRKKLGDDPAEPRFIHTVRGVGFRFRSANEGRA